MNRIVEETAQLTRLLKLEDVENLVVGATIFGTGGGGDPEEGLSLLRKDLSEGRRLQLASRNDLNPESIVVCAYHCGSIAAPGQEGAGKRREETRHEGFMLAALRAMETRLGKRVGGVIATEIGGGNTPAALHLAALLGVPAIDADQVGRSAPELVQSSYLVNGVEATPSVVADTKGDITVVEKYGSPAQYEAIVRSLAVAAGGSAFVIDSPVPAARAFTAGIEGTVSKAIELGKAIGNAAGKREDPVVAAKRFLDAFTLFHGEISEYTLEEKAGFLVGDVWIDGRKECSGSKLRVWVKNENIVAWRDDKPAAISPDLICLLDPSGHGVTNSAIRKGQTVSVLAARSPAIWRTAKGIDFFGPRHFGFEFDYVSIERLLNAI
jgi:DUF917 family protein